MQVLIAFFPESGQGGLVEEIGEMGLGMLVEVSFREGDDFGVVPVVEADPHAVGGRIAGNLHEPDPGRIKYLLHIIAYFVYFSLICHHVAFSQRVKDLSCHSSGFF